MGWRSFLVAHLLTAQLTFQQYSGIPLQKEKGSHPLTVCLGLGGSGPLLVKPSVREKLLS